jgi:hypothetical protein
MAKKRDNDDGGTPTLTPEEATRNEPRGHEGESRPHARARHSWGRGEFMRDLERASRRATQEIEADPAQAAALDRSMQQAREGHLISQEELDRELGDDDE